MLFDWPRWTANDRRADGKRCETNMNRKLSVNFRQVNRLVSALTNDWKDDAQLAAPSSKQNRKYFRVCPKCMAAKITKNACASWFVWRANDAPLVSGECMSRCVCAGRDFGLKSSTSGGGQINLNLIANENDKSNERSVEMEMRVISRKRSGCRGTDVITSTDRKQKYVLITLRLASICRTFAESSSERSLIECKFFSDTKKERESGPESRHRIRCSALLWCCGRQGSVRERPTKKSSQVAWTRLRVNSGIGFRTRNVMSKREQVVVRTSRVRKVRRKLLMYDEKATGQWFTEVEGRGRTIGSVDVDEFDSGTWMMTGSDDENYCFRRTGRLSSECSSLCSLPRSFGHDSKADTFIAKFNLFSKSVF
jgi:hypothetical protein